MLRGVGIDIVEVARIERAMTRHPRFKWRVFTEGEITYCEGKPNPPLHFAARFSAKEAILKAIGTGFRGVKCTDIEICRDELGRPFVVFIGRAKDRLEEIGVAEVLVSLSFTSDSAVAMAAAIKKGD
ncbi:MAG: holo-ACP synthase [Actinomycetota bacterium]|nr:holo-ACP synthase [Actinomycetota bacterium]